MEVDSKESGAVADHPLRVTLVLGSFDIGGTETQVCDLAIELQQRGHAVNVVAICAGGPLQDRLASASVPYHVAHFQGLTYRNAARQRSAAAAVRSLRELWSYWQLLMRLEPEVCHAFLPGACDITLPGAALWRVPVRVAGRRSLPSELIIRRRDRFMARLALATTTAIVANSEAVAADSLRTDRVRPARLHVIPNGVRIPDQQSDVGRSPATGLMVANLIEYKGHRELLDALTMLPSPPRIRLVGDGPEREYIKNRLRDDPALHSVTLEGSVRNAGRLFAEVQFAVLASHHEGMPNAVLEAMASGVPVIATAVGGVPELIRHEEHGLLVPPKEPAALAAALERMSGDAPLRRRLGENARKQAERLSWRRCADAHERLYSELYLRKVGGAKRRVGLISCQERP